MQVPIIFFSQIEFFIWLFVLLFSWPIRYLICFRSISCVMSAMAVSVLSAIPGVVSRVIRIVFRFLLLMLCICCFSWLFTFKSQLDRYLRTIPDLPSQPGYNSLDGGDGIQRWTLRDGLAAE